MSEPLQGRKPELPGGTAQTEAQSTSSEVSGHSKTRAITCWNCSSTLFVEPFWRYAVDPRCGALNQIEGE